MALIPALSLGRLPVAKAVFYLLAPPMCGFIGSINL